jgi:uncharacterized protein YggE
MNNKFAAMFAVAFAVSSSVLCSADEALPLIPYASSNQGISVTGHAEVNAKPDIAYANLGVVLQAPNQDDAVSQDATKADAVKAALIKAGVAEADIKTDYYQVQPEYDYKSSTPVLVGYQASNFFKVSIHNLPKAGVIVDKASQAGANQVNGVTYDLTDRTQVEAQALAAAVTNARSKADLMAGVAGVTVGRLLNLDETGEQTSQPRPFPMFMRANAAAAAPAEPPTPLTPQDIVITADVTALYAIGYGK